jgi:hypothetical protein
MVMTLSQELSEVVPFIFPNLPSGCGTSQVPVLRFNLRRTILPENGNEWIPKPGDVDTKWFQQGFCIVTQCRTPSPLGSWSYP